MDKTVFREKVYWANIIILLYLTFLTRIALSVLNPPIQEMYSSSTLVVLLGSYEIHALCHPSGRNKTKKRELWVWRHERNLRNISSLVCEAWLPSFYLYRLKKNYLWFQWFLYHSLKTSNDSNKIEESKGKDISHWK